MDAANREVEEAICIASSGKRGPYRQYSLTVRAEIGIYILFLFVITIFIISFVCLHLCCQAEKTGYSGFTIMHSTVT